MGNSVINLGDLAKPIDTLIERISDAIGTIYEPHKIRELAKANADAKKTVIQSEIEITELEQRASQRFMYEQVKVQRNIESITALALPQLTTDAKPEGIEEDWITNFFNKCRHISDKEMQDIWSRILAGEANAPGTFTKRTINLMESLDKNDAQSFVKLCSFNWKLGDNIGPLIYDSKAEIYTSKGINFNVLQHLDVIGLICFEPLSGYKILPTSQTIVVTYQASSYNINLPNKKDNAIQVGKVLLTNVGKELASICVPEAVDGLSEYIIEQWKKQGIEICQ